MQQLITHLITGVLFIIFALIIYVKYWTYTYWERKKFHQIPPKFPFGNVGNPFTRTRSITEQIQDIYLECKQKGLKHIGIYMLIKPVYVPIDLEFVKNILTKDFYYFTDRGIYTNEKIDPLSGHLFAVGGLRWKNLRVKLTPTFTSGKMKLMFETLIHCTPALVKKIETEFNTINIKEVLACFTTDIIGSCAFGLEFHTFEDDNSPFRVYGRKIFQNSRLRRTKTAFMMNFPKFAQFLGLGSFSADVNEFFQGVVRKTLNYRKLNKINRNDFLQILIELHDNDPSFTIDQMVAQCFLFFLAGFETSSTTVTFALYELARHQDIQDKLRQEIEYVLKLNKGNIIYESLNEMKYLTQVLNESLRMYPPVPMLDRQCVKTYKIPGTNQYLNKGQKILIPVMGIHYDEEFYPNPYKFDPDRFDDVNKSKIPSHAHLPFGEGPRNCIGIRFGLMQSKIALIILLKNFKFTLNKKTTVPIKFSPATFILSAKGDIWLDAKKIKSIE